MTKLLCFLVAIISFNAFAEDTESIINDLSDEDRKVVIEIKQEISTWPKAVKDEIKSYQDLIILLRAQAQEKYDALSAESKNALKKQEQLTSKLSPPAIAALENEAKEYLNSEEASQNTTRSN
jgi:hypothetical protein